MAIRRVVIAALLASTCSKVDRGQSNTVSIAPHDTIPLDSCARLDSKGTPQRRVLEPGEEIPPPHPGSWTPTKRFTLDSVQFILPVSAHARSDTAHGSYFISELPGCRYFCGLEVIFVRDSVDRSLSDYVASLRVVDSTTNSDAEMWIPGPPRNIRLAASDGLIMETTCGDCTSGQIVAKRGRTIAHIGYSLDDRDGSQPGLMCRLARAASTFDWLP